MTQNAKMRAPKEMEIETLTPQYDSGARARQRMERICATPEEVARYHYDPNAARENLRPGIPLDGDDTDYSD